MELMLYVEYVIFALCSLTLVECWYVWHDVERGLYIKNISVCKMGLTGLHDSYGSWHLYICRFLFGLSTFLSLHSCLGRALRIICVKRRKKSR